MKCVYCQEEISFNERRKLAFKKDKKCPNCNKELKFTKASLFIGVGIYFIYLLLLLKQDNWNSFYFIGYMVILWIISSFSLPFIAKYDKK